MLRFRKLKMQMKKLLKNNEIECRKAPQTERFAELFSAQIYASTFPSGNALRNTLRTNGPATMS